MNLLPRSLMLILLGSVAACTTNPLQVRYTSCPAVAIPKYTGTLTQFSDSGQFEAKDVQVVASITNLRSTCTEDEKAAKTTIVFDVLASRPTQAGGLPPLDLPYFVVVVKDGQTLLAKQVYNAPVQFDPTARSTTVRQTVVATSPKVPIPPKKKREEGEGLAPPPKPSQYEVLVGFQLADAQAVYNLTR